MSKQRSLVMTLSVAVLAVAAAGSAFADDPTPDNYASVPSVKTRAQVASELAQAKADGSAKAWSFAYQNKLQTQVKSEKSESDSVLTTWLLVDNENEIAIARIGVQRATNPDVKQFAQRMIDDHGTFVQKLNQVSTSGARVGQTDRTGQEPTRNDPSRTGQPADASGIRALGSFDHERLVRELGQKCLESTTKMLQEKQGAEFDRCFMGMQIGMHTKAADTLEVFRNHASSTLKPTLDEGLKTVQTHLQHAKELVKRTEVASADGARK